VNTLGADRAVLLVMLTEGALSLDSARAAIAARPAGGWGDGDDFWATPGLTEAKPENEALGQITLRPRYLRLDTEVAFRDAEVVSSALFEIDPAGEPRLAARRWTRDE